MGVERGYKVVECANLKAYKKFIGDNPYIEIVSVFPYPGVIGDDIIVTYKGQLGNPSSKSRRMM